MNKYDRDSLDYSERYMYHERIPKMRHAYWMIHQLTESDRYINSLPDHNSSGIHDSRLKVEFHQISR